MDCGCSRNPTFRVWDSGETPLSQKLQRIAKSLDTDDISAWHGLTKSIPKHALTEQDVLRIKTFICMYAKDNALPLPGRLPNVRQSHLL